MRIFNNVKEVSYDDIIFMLDECIYNINVINGVLNNSKKDNYEDDMIDFMMSFSSKDFIN